jgi:hypothetical protein
MNCGKATLFDWFGKGERKALLLHRYDNPNQSLMY